MSYRKWVWVKTEPPGIGPQGLCQRCHLPGQIILGVPDFWQPQPNVQVLGGCFTDLNSLTSGVVSPVVSRTLHELFEQHVIADLRAMLNFRSWQHFQIAAHRLPTCEKSGMRENVQMHLKAGRRARGSQRSTAHIGSCLSSRLVSSRVACVLPVSSLCGSPRITRVSPVCQPPTACRYVSLHVAACRPLWHRGQLPSKSSSFLQDNLATGQPKSPNRLKV